MSHHQRIRYLRTSDGVKLAWVGVSGATGYRVYRSATPEGPFCALLDSGVTPSPPLPSEYEVAYAIATKAPGSLVLPFFSRVTLKSTFQQLRNLGYQVTLTKIECR